MAQQKKTENFEIGELPELTEKQMAFVKGLLAGKSASDAYREAYNTEEMQDRTIWASASRLRHNTNVAAWLLAARTANLGSATVTLDSHLQELERLREIALGTGNVGAAVQAEVSRGKAAGHYVEKVEDVTRDTDPATLIKRIEQDLGTDIARQIAAQEGIEWSMPTKH